MHSDYAMKIEAEGARRGINPMFGEWRKIFRFSPVPYGNGKALEAFREKIQTELTNRFLYSNEIQIIITLYVDVQTVLETSDTADVDNYAKAILDCLRGPNGIMLDDTQVQALTISWIDHHETYFEIEARGNPDEFILKPVQFYEMPDGLWYPQCRLLWTVGEAEEIDDFNFYTGLLITHMTASTQRSVRRIFRDGGMTRLQAYQNGRYMATSARGFHKSRVHDAGWDMIDLKDWRAQYELWKGGQAEDRRQLVESMLSEMKTRWDQLAEAMVQSNQD